MDTPAPAPVEDENISKTLFQFAMKREWDNVVELCKKQEGALDKQVTKSGDTALHIAVSDSREGVVKQLVGLIKKKSYPSDSLRNTNDEGNTVLHTAAKLGSVTMCKDIAKADATLVFTVNQEGETPLFLAAHHRNKEAFIWLYNFACREGEMTHIRTKDGDTILHSAINGEYFDIAFHIIALDKDLVNAHNKKGETPLHILARKPNVFQSYRHLRMWEKIIYNCTLVTQVKVNHRQHSKNPENRTVIPGNGMEQREGKKIDIESQKGSTNIIRNMSEKKEKHIRSVQVLDQLLEDADLDTYLSSGRHPEPESNDETTPYVSEVPPDHEVCMQESPSTAKQNTSNGKSTTGDDERGDGKETNKTDDMVTETPILVAAKNGITEIVDKILKKVPVAIHDVDTDRKNIALLAVENRQPDVYRLLLKSNILMKANVLGSVDKEGNSALHLAARLGERKPWHIPGAALQMQWEVKWYEVLTCSKIILHVVDRCNKYGKTPEDIFTKTHKDLVKDGGEWLNNTSQSCSVVAALVATVAFATSATVPGGIKDANGTPVLERQPAFKLFAVSSLVALCFSVTSVVMFLAILTSRRQPKDFGRDLPIKLLFGLTSLFVSIASILICFCAGHFFILRDELKHAALPVYAVTCLPVTFFAMAQFPLYLDLIWVTFKKVPQKISEQLFGIGTSYKGVFEIHLLKKKIILRPLISEYTIMTSLSSSLNT
ncbi:ankyrin repeat-containing protein ITN1-like [Tripterygium wilfordii]|uniref:ankyrin repeat-containing protein ITN1-like n=1 Tax=Tripterygium wilfordii TaxID=458696 RepID=UPI0018F80243|nr:ankyrin repeat-containing protein ITN1-like [Tripterygium wilfordii]